VSISGDTIVVGAPGEDSNALEVNGDQRNNSAPNSGAAYVFVREETIWSQQAYLKTPKPGAGAVSISGDTIVAGRYAFVRHGTNWVRQAHLKASNVDPEDEFLGSRRVAISGDFAVFGAPQESSNATGINGNQYDKSAPASGAAYVFERHGTSWSQRAYLKGSNTASGDSFGNMVAASGDTILVAASGEDSSATLVNGDQNNNNVEDSGAAYVFTGFTPCISCPPSFILQPRDQIVLPGTNVSVQALAAGPGPMHYQWRFEGTDIPGATNSSYSFTNASLSNGHGSFSVVARNEFGSASSSNALIFVRIQPAFETHLRTRSVLEGRDATFSCLATGAPPIYYRWAVTGRPLVTNTTGTLTLSNVLISITNGVRCHAINAVGARPGLTASLIVMPDSDRDGMADSWEVQYGFQTNNPADALLDSDGDGMSNRDEYVAHTNPTSSSSALKISILSTNRPVLRFTAEADIAYSLQVAADPAAGIWQVLSNVAPANVARLVEILDPTVVPPSGRYFRVVATPP
jgi:hypothetical protein